MPRGSHLLVAVSGGPDSMAMLDVLDRLSVELGLRLSVASIDHGLRPEAANEVRFVGEAAEARCLPFRSIALQLERGTSHARAREARYEALRALASELAADAIAVGHTLDDQAETVLARLLRGSGVRGLRGIKRRREDGVVRPLLDARRVEVRAHLERHQVGSIEDPSNSDRRFLRVRVRRDILPTLESESAAVARHLAALADEAAVVAEQLDAEVRGFGLRAGGTITSEALETLSPAARPVAIAEFVRHHTGSEPGRRVIHAILDALARGGDVRIGQGLALRGSPGQLELGSAQRPSRSVRPRG